MYCWCSYGLYICLLLLSTAKSQPTLSASICSGKSKGDSCNLDCTTTDLNDIITFTDPSSSNAGGCSSGAAPPVTCGSGVTGYSVSQPDSTTTRLTILTLQCARDLGSWSCAYGASSSTPVSLTFSSLLQTPIITPNDASEVTQDITFTCSMNCQFPTSSFSAVELRSTKDDGITYTTLQIVTSLTESTPASGDGCDTHCNEKNIAAEFNVKKDALYGDVKFSCRFKTASVNSDTEKTETKTFPDVTANPPLLPTIHEVTTEGGPDQSSEANSCPVWCIVIIVIIAVLIFIGILVCCCTCIKLVKIKRGSEILKKKNNVVEMLNPVEEVEIEAEAELRWDFMESCCCKKKYEWSKKGKVLKNSDKGEFTVSEHNTNLQVQGSYLLSSKSVTVKVIQLQIHQILVELENKLHIVLVAGNQGQSRSFEYTWWKGNLMKGKGQVLCFDYSEENEGTYKVSVKEDKIILNETYVNVELKNLSMMIEGKQTVNFPLPDVTWVPSQVIVCKGEPIVVVADGRGDKEGDWRYEWKCKAERVGSNHPVLYIKATDYKGGSLTVTRKNDNLRKCSSATVEVTVLDDQLIRDLPNTGNIKKSDIPKVTY